MRTRRHAREAALQMLYQLDVQPELGIETALARYFACFASLDEEGEDPEARHFAERLVRGAWGERGDIDRRIAEISRNWRLERMARVDRNLLRLAVYEMCYTDDVPAKVAINEAIEIAKRYGTQETPAFINGILDRVLEQRKT